MNDRAAARGTPAPQSPAVRAAALRGPVLLPPSVARRTGLEQRAGMALDQQTPATNDTEDPNDVGQREDAAANEKTGGSDDKKDAPKASDDDTPKSADEDDTPHKPEDDDTPKSEKNLPGEVTREPVWFDSDPGPGWAPTTGPEGQAHDEREGGTPPPIKDKGNADYDDTMVDDKGPHAERGQPANPWDAKLNDLFSGGSSDEQAQRDDSAAADADPDAPPAAGMDVQKGLLTPIDPPTAQDLVDQRGEGAPKGGEDSDDMDYLLPWDTHGDDSSHRSLQSDDATSATPVGANASDML